MGVAGGSYGSLEVVGAGDLFEHARVVGVPEVGREDVEVHGVVLVVNLLALRPHGLRLADLAHVVLLDLVLVDLHLELVLGVIDPSVQPLVRETDDRGPVEPVHASPPLRMRQSQCDRTGAATAAALT